MESIDLVRTAAMRLVVAALAALPLAAPAAAPPPDFTGVWGVASAAPRPAARAGRVAGWGGYPMEIIQRPEQITLIFELHGEVLVVETTHLVEQLDQRATPHSDEAIIVERYRVEGTNLQGQRMLVAEVTMHDLKSYTEPVVLTRRWTQVPNGHLLPCDCNEEIWRDRLDQLAKKAGVKLP
jgi:hypothetical protein